MITLLIPADIYNAGAFRYFKITHFRLHTTQSAENLHFRQIHFSFFGVRISKIMYKLKRRPTCESALSVVYTLKLCSRGIIWLS